MDGIDAVIVRSTGEHGGVDSRCSASKEHK